MFGRRWLVIALITGVAAGEARAQATVFWTGARSSTPNFDDANNRVGLAVPVNGTFAFSLTSTCGLLASGLLTAGTAARRRRP